MTRARRRQRRPRYQFDEADGATVLDSSPATGATPPSRPRSIRRPTAGQGVQAAQRVSQRGCVPWKDQQNFAPFTEGLVPEHRRVQAGAALLRRRARVPDHAVLHGEPASTRRWPRRSASPAEQLLEHQLDAAGAAVRAGAARVPVAVHHPRTCTGACSSGSTWTQYVGGDNRYPDNNEFFFNWNPDDPDARPLGHPPQHPRRLQLHDHRRHRRRPAAAGRRGWSCGRSTSAGTTSRSTTSATTAAT